MLRTLIFWSVLALQIGGASHKEPVYSQPSWCRIFLQDKNKEPEFTGGL